MRLKEYPIGDYVDKCQTWNPKSSGVGSFDYIDLSSVDKNAKSIVSIERYECSDAPSRARQLVETDDVLVATVRPNLNGVALVNGAHHGMTASTGYCVLRPDKYKLDSRFLFHWVKTGVFVQRMVDVAIGANYPAVSDAKVKASKIPLPALAEQKRIARILDAADALRTKRREALAQFDTLLQSTFLDMFGDPVTNPMGWNVVAFESIGNSRLGKMLDKGKEVGDRQFPYLANTNVQWGRFDLTALRTMDFSESDCEEFKLEDGDLLICEGGEVGRTAIWHGAHNRIYFQKALHRVRLDPTVAVPEYVFQFMWFMAKNGGFRDLTTSATIAHLTGVKLKRLPCPRPPLKLQHRYAVIVKSVEQQKTSQRAHLADLDTLFASLQSRAFRGDL